MTPIKIPTPPFWVLEPDVDGRVADGLCVGATVGEGVATNATMLETVTLASAEPAGVAAAMLSASSPDESAAVIVLEIAVAMSPTLVWPSELAIVSGSEMSSAIVEDEVDDCVRR